MTKLRTIGGVLLLIAGLAGAAGAAGPPSGLEILRQSQAVAGFARASQPRVFEFPRDHGPHPDFRHEWWYITGNLDTADGQRFGFELTFFRLALAPTDTTPPGGSSWRSRQIYEAHFAVTDVARGAFRYSRKRSREALGLAGARSDSLHVWLDDWTLGSPSPGQDWTVHAQGEGYDLTLNARPLSQPVLNGQQGLSLKSAGAGAGSYYYSVPRIEVRGSLTHAGVRNQVQGLAWLDREWGSGSLADNQQGWDWFALQMKDGSTLMFYSLRTGAGKDAHSSGTWVDPFGVAKSLSAQQVLIDVKDYWTSPRGGRYPSSWRVRVPSVGLDVEVRPVMSDQELGGRPRYWEGAVDLNGVREGHDILGRGYVELVGYGE